MTGRPDGTVADIRALLLGAGRARDRAGTVYPSVPGERPGTGGARCYSATREAVKVEQDARETPSRLGEQE
jgi:hypothetical protein